MNEHMLGEGSSDLEVTEGTPRSSAGHDDAASTTARAGSPREEQSSERRVWPWFTAVVLWAFLALLLPVLLGAFGQWHSPVNQALWLLRPGTWESLIAGWVRNAFGLGVAVNRGWIAAFTWVAGTAVILVEILALGWLIGRLGGKRGKQSHNQRHETG